MRRGDGSVTSDRISLSTGAKCDLIVLHGRP
jgi:hypothetical protein